MLAHYRLSPDYLVPVTQKKLQIEVVEEKQVEIVPEEPQLEESEFAESSQVLLELDISPISETSNTTQRQRKPLVLLLGLLALLLGGATVGLFAWQQLQPQTLQQMCRRLPQRVQQLCLPRK